MNSLANDAGVAREAPLPIVVADDTNLNDTVLSDVDRMNLGVVSESCGIAWRLWFERRHASSRAT